MRATNLFFLLPLLATLAMGPVSGRAADVGSGDPADVTVTPLGHPYDVPGTVWTRQDSDVEVLGITVRTISFVTYSTIQPLRPRPGLEGPQAQLAVYCARGNYSVDVTFLTPIGDEDAITVPGGYRVDQRPAMNTSWDLERPNRRTMRHYGPGAPVLLESMLGGHRMLVEAPLQQFGQVVVGFDITGLREALMTRGEECGLL